MVANCAPLGWRGGLHPRVAIALCALGVLLSGVARTASAEILALDCIYNGELLLKVWVDLEKSTVTLQGAAQGDLPIRTYTARVSATSIKWKWNNGGQATDASIDRRTGVLAETYRDVGGGAGTNGPYACAKGSTPPPAAKF